MWINRCVVSMWLNKYALLTRYKDRDQIVHAVNLQTTKPFLLFGSKAYRREVLVTYMHCSDHG